MMRQLCRVAPVALVAATACSRILGIDEDSVSVACSRDSDCPSKICQNHECKTLGSMAGVAGNSLGFGGGGVGAGAVATQSGSFNWSGSAGNVAVAPTLGGSTGTESRAGSVSPAAGSGGVPDPGDASSIGVAAQGNSAAKAGTPSVVSTDGTSSSGGGMSAHGAGRAGTAASTSTDGMPSSGRAAQGGAETNTGTSGITWAAGAQGVGGIASVASGGSAASETTGSAGITQGTASGGTASAPLEGGAGAGAAAGQSCEQGEHRCLQDPNVTRIVAWETCDAQGRWGQSVSCPAYCLVDAGCVSAPSCEGLGTCAPHQSCCNSAPIPSGTFNRSPIDDEEDQSCSSENACPAEISPFMLDVFEVTVGRFRKFVAKYPKSIPSSGAGKNPNNPNDTGWNDRWNDDEALLPKDPSALIQALASCGVASTYAEIGNDLLPINCVNWYLAFAFCAWDGGRLPTEAEWNYAASGSQNRVYPWSNPAYADDINASFANYQSQAPRPVGQAAAGKSLWGQFDLAGNVSEWTVDAYVGTYPTTNCIDCADTRWSSPARIIRGGTYDSSPDDVKVGFRGTATAIDYWKWTGFRCARNLLGGLPTQR
jgi:formylglycine-generating enzyme